MTLKLIIIIASNGDVFLDRDFSYEEVLKAIKTLHVGKAPGFDDLVSKHLLYAGPLLTDLLCVLYNSILEFECIPECFR